MLKWLDYERESRSFSTPTNKITVPSARLALLFPKGPLTSKARMEIKCNCHKQHSLPSATQKPPQATSPSCISLREQLGSDHRPRFQPHVLWYGYTHIFTPLLLDQAGVSRMNELIQADSAMILSRAMWPLSGGLSALSAHQCGCLVRPGAVSTSAAWRYVLGRQFRITL